MYAASTVRRALALSDAGAPVSDIVARLGIPRSTVRTWLRGELPRSLREQPAGHCGACNAAEHDFDQLPASYVYLLGLYLGDGCIAEHARQVFKLRVNLDAVYPGIIEECEAAIRDLLPANRVGRLARPSGGFANSRDGGSVEVSCYSRSWPCLLPQHGPGRKHERPIVLTDWQAQHVDRHPEVLLRGLIHSDGCRFINTGTNWSNPRYSFSNRSGDIRAIFTDACDRMGIHWTTAPNTVYVSRKDDVARLDEHVGPKR